MKLGGNGGGSNSGPSGMPSTSISCNGQAINALALSPDGTKVATAARDGIMRVHELSTGILLMGFKVGPLVGLKGVERWGGWEGGGFGEATEIC